MRHYTVENPEGNSRLDKYLVEALPGATRSFLQWLIENGNIFVNNKKITKSAHKLKARDELIVNLPRVKEVGILPEAIPLKVIYEDSNVIVLNKAPGMVVHPTDHGGHVSGTLVNALLYHCQDLSGINGEKRPGIVHRLDKDTSGLIMVAKNDRAHQHLSKQIQGRTLTKKYLTLLKGHLTPLAGSIEAPLFKKAFDKEGKNVLVSAEKGAKYALTHYRVLEYLGPYSLVEVTIVTGRTHQIRVHFASIHHPVAGDRTYGDPPTNEELKKLGLQRQFLHAWRLTLKLPSADEEVEMEAPLPEDLENVLKRLRNQEAETRD